MSEEEEKKTLDVSAQALSIYEKGALKEITIKELVGNEIAITQLVNDHNISLIKLTEKDKQIENIIRERDYLKTSPFINICSSVFNVIGSILLALSINKLTLKPDDKNNQIILIISGLIIIFAQIMNIVYPFMRKNILNVKNEENIYANKK